LSLTRNFHITASAGTAQLYSSVPEFYTCLPGQVIVVSAAAGAPPPPPYPPAQPGQCASITGITATSSPGAPAAFTGVYQAVCPTSCGSTCRYGCLYCADGSYIGLYGNDNICAQAQQYGSGSLLHIAGNAEIYNGAQPAHTSERAIDAGHSLHLMWSDTHLCSHRTSRILHMHRRQHYADGARPAITAHSTSRSNAVLHGRHAPVSCAPL